MSLVNDPFRLEWLHDESSVLKISFLLNLERKGGKKRKNVRFSPSIYIKGKDQENLGQPKKRGRPRKDDAPKLQKEQKKNDDHWYVLNYRGLKKKGVATFLKKHYVSIFFSFCWSSRDHDQKL
jgi:hypothetical protein